MTEREAIEIIKYASAFNSDNSSLTIALDIAIKVLEKQIPKKPTDQTMVRDNEGYVGLIGKCPHCGEILEEDTVYCDCGQKLDWSE